MCEDAARLRLDEAEARHRVQALETLLEGTTRELHLFRGRVRELEDAIAIHAKQAEAWHNEPCDEDHELWAKLDRMWT